MNPDERRKEESNMIGESAIRKRGRETGFIVKVDKKQTPYTYYIKDKEYERNPVIKTCREGAIAFLFGGIDEYLFHCEALDIEPF